MDLRLVEIFCLVYKERSFSQAARELDLTQPTISAHIKELERSLGTPLFHRLGREIEPTEAGRFLYEQARSILSFKRGLTEKMNGFLNRIEGDLVVGASSVPGEYLLPGILVGFQEKHPGVKPRLRIRDTAATIEDLRHGEIQLGVVGASREEADLVFEPFASDTLVLVVPATGAWRSREEVSLAELHSLPLLIREPGSGTRTALERALTDHGLDLGSFCISAELDSTTALKQAIKEGHGVSFMSELTVSAERAGRVLRVVRVPEFGAIRRRFYTVVSRRRPLSPLGQAFLAYLAERRHPN